MKEVIKIAAPYFFGALLIYIIFKSLTRSVGKGFEGLKTGDIFKSSSEIETDKNILNVNSSVNWFELESKLPLNQKTTIKRLTARTYSDALLQQFRTNILGAVTMTTANEIYNILGRIGTLGSLYYLFAEFGIRDNMNLDQYLRLRMGFDGNFSKNLYDVNDLFSRKRINYKF
jgi:hypothetical protein